MQLQWAVNTQAAQNSLKCYNHFNFTSAEILIFTSNKINSNVGHISYTTELIQQNVIITEH
jgi:hypothetical protein